MTDTDDRLDERAESALRSALDQRGRAYEPSDLDLSGLTRSSRRTAMVRIGAAAAAAAVVVGGTSIGLGWWGIGSEPDTRQPSGPSTTSAQPIGPPADNGDGTPPMRLSRAGAVAQAEQALTVMPVPTGARQATAAEVPPLAKLQTFVGGLDRSVIRSDFWLVPASAVPLAHWYVQHPPADMRAEGGVGGSRNSDGSWSQEVFYDGLAGGDAANSSTLIQVTPVGELAGVRITVFTSWQPARPAASLVSDAVTSARLVINRDGHRMVATVDDAADLSRLEDAYNGLLGTAGIPHSCPMIMGQTTYRVTFVSPTRELSAFFGGSCDSSWQITVDGRPQLPALRGDERFSTLIDHLVVHGDD